MKKILPSALALTFIVPGTRINVSGKGAGALIDVATGQPILFVSSQSTATELSPTFLAEDNINPLRAQVRDELIAKLSDELIKQLTDLKFQPIHASR